MNNKFYFIVDKLFRLARKHETATVIIVSITASLLANITIAIVKIMLFKQFYVVLHLCENKWRIIFYKFAQTSGFSFVQQLSIFVSFAFLVLPNMRLLFPLIL